MREGDWRSRAACRDEDTSLFFPAEEERSHDKRRRERVAKAICARCDVTAQCFEAGREEYGIWGGLNEKERAHESSRVILHRVDASLPEPSADVGGPWVVVDKRGEVELWQRDSSNSWHGSEWSIVKGVIEVRRTNSLAEAYIAFEKCYVGSV